MRTVLPLAALILLVSACSDPEPAPPPPPSSDPAATAQQPSPAPAPAEPPAPLLHEYSCADGLMFDVVFHDQQATLHISEQRFDLHQQPSASGALYSDERWSLFTKGERAMLSADDLSHECAVRTAKTLTQPDQLPALPGGAGG